MVPVGSERRYRTLYPNLEYLKRYSKSFIGTPYKYGGADRTGMDCSGFVVRVFSDIFDMKIPHSTKKLLRMGREVGENRLCTGDLLFFYSNGLGISHVGIYLENNSFIHASSSRGVIISKMDNRYYRRNLAGIRRIIAERK